MPHASCSVIKCTNHSKKLNRLKNDTCNQHAKRKGECGCLPFTLFKFPHEAEIKSKWIRAINRQKSATDKTLWEPASYSVVCSEHFVENRPTETNPIPTIKLGYNVAQQIGQVPKHRFPNKAIQDRNTAALISTKKRTNTVVTSASASLPSTTSSVHHFIPHEPMDIGQAADELVCYSDVEIKPKIQDCVLPCVPLEAECQDSYNNIIKQLEKENNKLKGHIFACTLQGKSQRNQLRKLLLPVNKTLLKSDKDVSFYTGLPKIEVFHSLVKYYNDLLQIEKKNKPITFNIVAKYRKYPLVKKSTSRLCSQDRVLLVLMKLRLGCLHKDLGDRFKVTLSDVSRIFSETLPILAKALKPLIVFYTKDNTKRSLPKEFHSTKNIRCIIDCTEVFIQRPSDLKLQAATWSDYKHHNTIKCLVAIAPQGSISFVSEFFGGRTSDRVVVTASKFLDFIEPGDQVLADRGFPLREVLLIKNAELVLPPAAKGVSQMTSAQVKKTKTVANVRIHVERVIRRIKQFRILSQIFPISLLPHANDILIVCSAITNLHGPIVKSWGDL